MSANILVIDDTTANLELLESILDDEGYEVRTSISGEMGLRAIEAQAPDLILLDIMMPGIDGYETCRLIKQNPHFKDIPVIFLSAKNESEDIVEAFQAGGVDYVNKPFNTDELLARIRTHLTISNLQKELSQKVSIIDKHIISTIMDMQGFITDVSQAFCDISGYSKEELIGQPHNAIQHDDMSKKVVNTMWDTLKQGNVWQGEIKNKKRDGTPYWVDALMVPILDKNGNTVGVKSIRQDISDKKRVEELSITDQLTNLYNRRHFNSIIIQEIQHATRQQVYLSLIMIDIDYFKQYNDTYGHQEGDTTLKSVANAIKTTLQRGSDFAFRLGGEEFGVLCITNSCSDADTIAEKIRKNVEDLKIPHKGSQIAQSVTISLGVACVNFSSQENYNMSDDELYKHADDELYRAKESGRNRVSISTL